MKTRNKVVSFESYGLERAQNCSSCLRKVQCPVFTLLADRKQPFSQSGIRQLTYQAGDLIEYQDEPFECIYIVRSGFFKTFYIDNDGEMQITGFHFPGEIFGINDLSDSKHIKLTDALDSSSVCKIPLAFFLEGEGSGAWKGQSGIAEQGIARRQLVPGEKTLLCVLGIIKNLFSHDLNFLFSLLKMPAHGRMAAFLIDISARMDKSGYKKYDFRLCMNRRDIANHLNLTGETVSRILAQFQSLNILSFAGRNLHILDMPKLQTFADGSSACKSLLRKVN